MRAGADKLRRKAIEPVFVLKIYALLRDFLHGKGFNNVAFLDVVEFLDGHAALVAGGDLLHLILKPLQGGQNALVDYNAVPHQANLAVLALDLAVLDIAAGHGAHAGDLVGLAHLGMAQQSLRYLGASMPFMAASISLMAS